MPETAELKVNLHTHTSRCKHAAGNVADYCREAVRQGIGVLGFSDHSPFPDGKFDGSRMKFEDLASYCADIESARREFPTLRILAGLEIDYRPELGTGFYREEYLGRLGLDYLIGGAHFAMDASGHDLYIGGGKAQPEMFDFFIHQTILLLESGLITYLAHPDLPGLLCDRWDRKTEAGFREVIACATANGVPLEINAYGLRKPWRETSEGFRPGYPWSRFWELAGEMGAKATVGSDAHRPQDVWGNTDDCLAIANANHLAVENRELAARMLS